MRPPLYANLRLKPPASPRRSAAHDRHYTASQAIPGASAGHGGGATVPSKGAPVQTIPDYCEPYHCDPPREDSTGALLRTLKRETLMGTW